MAAESRSHHRHRIGDRVTVRFAGRCVEGVVRDLVFAHDQLRFEPRLKIACRGGATLSVPPAALIES